MLTFSPNLVDLNSIDKILRSILPLEENEREAGCFLQVKIYQVKSNRLFL